MPVTTGLERLFLNLPSQYRGARVGLIANQASVHSNLQHALDLFGSFDGFRLTTAFGPQHGARGDKQDNMIESEDYRDPRWNIPVYSLYSEHRKPTAAMLADLDILFCDLVDVGARIYTFMYTMVLAMQACAETDKLFVVLDRPNPINGMDVEGNVLDPAFRSFVGLYPIPMRHGMTMGELALFFNEEFDIKARLEVIPLEGWKREQWYKETGLPWIMPSPNMPTTDTAVVYPGTVLLEGTMLSEGRGVTRPFEMLGAPYIDSRAFAEELEKYQLPGVHFRPCSFRPTFNKWVNELCGGIQLHPHNRNHFKPYLTGLAILAACLKLYPERFAWKQPPYEYEYRLLPIDILLGTDTIRRSLEAGEDLRTIENSWQPPLQEFLLRRKKYLLY